MCVTCGCGDPSRHPATVDGKPMATSHDHGSSHGHHHDHPDGHGDTRRIRLEQDLLGENNRFAAANRQRFRDRATFVVNLVSSPGSGKTTLLARTAEALKAEMPVAVIEGDQQTSVDAERIRRAGVPAVQVNTGRICHLDAHMIGHAVEDLDLHDGGVLFIENVGNLVCPAEFDLGEDHKVVVMSVTEGEDKPLKYPHMFAAASLMLLNKTDLLPHVSFDVERCKAFARRANPDIAVFEISATTGVGMPHWLDWIGRGVERAKAMPDKEQFPIHAGQDS